MAAASVHQLWHLQRDMITLTPSRGAAAEMIPSLDCTEANANLSLVSKTSILFLLQTLQI